MPEESIQHPNPANNVLDTAVTDAVNALRRQGKGWTLQLVEKGGEVKVAVEEPLKPLDERLRRSDLRRPKIDSTAGMIEYAKHYGDPNKSVVFYSDKAVRCVLEYEMDKGQREYAQMYFTPHHELTVWQTLINQPHTHRDLVKSLRAYEHNLVTPDMIQVMRTATLTGSVDSESEMTDDGTTIGFKYKTKAGSDIKQYPRNFQIQLPVLDIDLEPTFTAECRLQIDMPTDPKHDVTFTVRCPRLALAMRERVMHEAELLREAMPGWRIIHGTDDYQERTVGAER